MNLDLNSTFANSMSLNLVFAKSMSLNLTLVFSKSMNLNLTLVFLKSMNLNLNLKIKNKMIGFNSINNAGGFLVNLLPQICNETTSRV